MRSEFPRKVWDKIRKEQYAAQDHHCGICKAQGRLNCHEIWEFDDAKRIQKLRGFIALCDLCHAVKHLGRTAVIEGIDRREVEQHFMRVNECDLRTFEQHGSAAFAQWEERSTHEWSCDLGEYQTLLTTREPLFHDQGGRTTEPV